MAAQGALQGVAFLVCTCLLSYRFIRAMKSDLIRGSRNSMAVAVSYVSFRRDWITLHGHVIIAAVVG